MQFLHTLMLKVLKNEGSISMVLQWSHLGCNAGSNGAFKVRSGFTILAETGTLYSLAIYPALVSVCESTFIIFICFFPISLTLHSACHTHMIRVVGRKFFSTAPKHNLSSILKKELDYEVNNNTIHQVYPHTAEFLKEQGWKIGHEIGKAEIVLSKQVDEYNVEMFIDCNEDAEAEIDEIDMVVDITKRGKDGVVSLDLLLDSEELTVENLSWYPNKDFQKSQQLRDDNYEGPMIDTLDQQVEDGVYEKLKELTIDTTLTDKIRDLKSWKEQKEYENWLSKIGSFFE
eukprot:NODE_45_length_27728_cov_0.328387.p8 type:complete len:287 gc:universal NODE_45_length_27728_cov_0.328387:1203-343(-)